MLAKRGSMVLLSRELIVIRGWFRYVDRHATDRALEELRDHLDGDLAEPLSVRCQIIDENALQIAITVPMFTDHSYASTWLELLARAAIDTTYDVRSRTL